MGNYVYHVVTERPMHLNQKIIFDDKNHSGVYKRVEEKKELINDIYNNKDKYQNINLDHHAKVALRELAMEEVRLKKYSQYPSRLSSLYVSKSLEDAYNWANLFISLNRNVLQIVKLKVKGNIFTGDAHNCFDGTIDKEYNLKEAESYWENKKNKKNKTPIYETIVNGEIEVIEIIKTY